MAQASDQEALDIIRQAFQEAREGRLADAVYLHLRELFVNAGNLEMAAELTKAWNEGGRKK